jgi:hypothetical protein
MKAVRKSLKPGPWPGLQARFGFQKLSSLGMIRKSLRLMLQASVHFRK